MAGGRRFAAYARLPHLPPRPILKWRSCRVFTRQEAMV
nr:MAG TPA: hypothetical protein [Caudoviricetes sp.]